MGDILAFVEQRDGAIRSVSREVVSAAAALASRAGGAVHGLAIGAPDSLGEASELGSFGASTVRVLENDALGRYVPEEYAALVADAVRDGGYGAVLFPATAQGKDLAPRVAALLDVPLASDVTALEVEGEDVYATRPIYGGKAFARLRFEGVPVLASLRPNAFVAEERNGSAEVERVSAERDAGIAASSFVRFEASSGGDLDVAEASTIVSGGRGMKEPGNWTLLEALRDALGDGAALGASRAVVDAGWRPHGEQVGQTGKTVSPNLYFAIGISGAIQHLAGMRTAGTIVAVNKDPEAPIFGVADYGVVGDLFEVVPVLTREISRLRES